MVEGVGAGYDAHWRDPLAGLQLRTSTYHWLCVQLQDQARDLCSGRILFILEVRLLILWCSTARFELCVQCLCMH